MTDVVLFPDATEVVGSFIRSELAARGDDTPVVSKVPNPRPDEFVLVRRTGGTSRQVVVDDAQVTVESWALTDADAHDRAQLCRGILNAALGATHAGTVIYRVTEAAGPGNLPDPESEQPRYSQSFVAALRGEPEAAGS